QVNLVHDRKRRGVNSIVQQYINELFVSNIFANDDPSTIHIINSEDILDEFFRNLREFYLGTDCDSAGVSLLNNDVWRSLIHSHSEISELSSQNFSGLRLKNINDEQYEVCSSGYGEHSFSKTFT